MAIKRKAESAEGNAISEVPEKDAPAPAEGV